MSAISRACLIAIALVPAALHVAWADAPGHVVGAIGLEQPVVRLPRAGDAVVRQSARVHLSEGPNKLSFAFGSLGIPVDRLETTIASVTEGVTLESLGDATISPDAADALQWELQAPQACEAVLTFTYPLKGIERSVEYKAVVDNGADTLDISADLVITNKSKLQFDSALVQMPHGRRFTTGLPLNETFRLRLFEAIGVPYRRSFIYDPPRYSGGTTAVMTVLRNSGGAFAGEQVWAGKVRIHAADKPATYISEDSLPYLPPGEAVDIKLGTVPDVAVTRSITRSARIDLNSDIRNKLVLFDQEDTVEISITNSRQSPLMLLVRDTIKDDWTMVDHSLPFEQLDAETVQFVVSLEPGAASKITYKARRHNLQP